MKNAWIVLGIFLLTGCATPVTVKQAIKKQSDAYGELQAALQEFAKSYVNLNNQLLRLNEESRLRIEALATVRGLAGYGPDSLGKNTWAKANYQQLSALAESLDTIPANRGDILGAFAKSAGYLEKSILYSRQESAKDMGAVQQTLKSVEDSQLNVLKELSALRVVHDTVGEYLEIDLSPDAKALKEAVSSIKALRK